MTIADEARDSAINCEMVKYAYRQSKDGIVVSFVVHPDDVPPGLATAPLGSRYIVALVQIGDDEKPIAARPQPSQPQAGAKEAMDWKDMQPAAQAGIRCANPTFRAFLREVRNCEVQDKLQAEIAIRDLCGVTSRTEFGTDPAKRVIWHQLDTEYQAWLARERVGA